ncbi:MAG: dihydroorotate dehydrogenase-like protein [Planctomycetota bacterium]
MDLATTYLGLELAHPLMPGASPLADDLDTVRRLEDAGAAAIVMRSLFEEQILLEERAVRECLGVHEQSFAEATTFLPRHAFALGPAEYLEHVQRIKRAVRVPLIASLNGSSLGGWLDFAHLIEQAGADALELNVYALATDPELSGAYVEQNILDMVRELKRSVKIPIAVKLGLFYSSLAHLAKQLEQVGVDGLVLFNRFYQPNIDIEQLEVTRALELSDSSELLLRLRWLAILSGSVRPSLACTGGVHTATDAIKAVMAGAHAVQLVAALLKRGPNYLRIVKNEMITWLEEHEYDSLAQARGSLGLGRCPDPKSYERANYIHVLHSWQSRQ